jgi:hypothetical protein
MTRKAAAEGTVLEHYVALLDEAFDRKAWHGTTLRGSVRRVDPATAAWRPGPNRHNIWEIVVHAAYWKYAVARRLAGGARGAFLVKGSNWFSRPGEMSAAAWRADVALLEQQHLTLKDVVTRLKVEDLPRKPAGSEHTRAYLLRGIAAHDLYHAGQIQLLKRLAS